MRWLAIAGLQVHPYSPALERQSNGHGLSDRIPGMQFVSATASGFVGFYATAFMQQKRGRFRTWAGDNAPLTTGVDGQVWGYS